MLRWELRLVQEHPVRRLDREWEATLPLFLLSAHFLHTAHFLFVAGALFHEAFRTLTAYDLGFLSHLNFLSVRFFHSKTKKAPKPYRLGASLSPPWRRGN